jgi:hypothetical protein
MIRRYGLFVVALLVGAWLGHCWMAPPHLPFVKVVVPKLPPAPLPRAQQSFVHRLGTVAVAARVTATTPLPPAPLPAVVSYCAPVLRHDTTTPPPPATLPPIAFSYKKRTLRIWSTLGDSRGYYSEHGVRAPWEAITVADSVNVTGPRFGWLRDCARHGLVTGVGGAALTITSHPLGGFLAGMGVGCIAGALF